MNMNEIVESWDNEKTKKWGRVILETIKRQHGEAAVNDPEALLQTGAVVASMMEKEVALQSSAVLAKVDQIAEEIKNK